MGTPSFAVPILEELINKYNVIMVVSQPDKEKDRKGNIIYSPCKEIGIKNNIEVLDEIEKEITEDVNHLEKVVKVKLLALIIDYYIEVSEYDKAIRYI